MQDPESCVFSIDYASLLLGTMGDSKQSIIEQINQHGAHSHGSNHGKDQQIQTEVSPIPAVT